MARSIWSGAVSFGLVNVPVKAYTAVRDHSVHFNQLEKGTGARIHYRKVSDKTGKEVPSDDIESGYEISPDHYVVFDPSELEKIRPRTTRTVDISDFVDLDQVDPIYYDHTYWLAPDGEAAERAYHLLVAAMEAEGKAGIGTVVMRNKQYLAAIRPLDGALAMSTMRFADEVVPQSAIDALPEGGARPEARELKLASQIIGSLTSDWDPQRYHDTYTEQVRELIEAKAKGREIVVDAEEPEDDTVLDLMAALQASLDSARGGGVGKQAPAAKKPATKKPSAQKPSAEKKAAKKKAPAKKSGATASSRKSA